MWATTSAVPFEVVFDGSTLVTRSSQSARWLADKWESSSHALLRDAACAIRAGYRAPVSLRGVQTLRSPNSAKSKLREPKEAPSVARTHIERQPQNTTTRAQGAHALSAKTIDDQEG